ncbi:MAG: hypothetical protein NTW33_02035 [Methanoregula sp.]|nr:hypothetical protein [Methanoregula sp.]
MTEKRNIEDDLKPSTGDYIHTGIKAGLSTAPYIGGPIAEFFSFVIAPPLEKRRNEWFIEIYKRLKTLEKTSEEFKPENLVKNEKIFSLFLQATQIAMRTHQKEKLDALRNAVINSISVPTIDENLQLIFLNLVDGYTPWHLKILHFFNVCRQKSDNHKSEGSNFSLLGITRDALGNAFPDLIGKQDIYEQIVKELVSNGLLEITTSYGKKMTDQRMVAFEITEMGKQFLNFISDSPGKLS